MRYAIPSPYDEETLSLMGALSGVTEEELRSEYNKASQELRLLESRSNYTTLEKSHSTEWSD